MRSPLPDPAVLARAVRAVWPGPPIRTIRVDETGWTNLMLEVDGRWMVRIPRWRSAAESLGFEVRLLEFLAGRTTIRVPSPRRIGVLEEPSGWPFLAYPKIPGAPLLAIGALDERGRTTLARFLARLFRDLDACPAGPLRRLGVREGDPRRYAERFRRLAARYRRIGAGRLPDALDRQVSAALREVIRTVAVSHFRPVLLHQDLWPSHILWDPGSRRPTGVIDWEDARLGDPAADLSALDGLGARRLARLGEGRRRSADRLFWRRLELYRCLLPLWGFLFGIETRNRALADRHRDELRVTFGSTSQAVPLDRTAS